MLSTGAFNALLKILEEPPEHVKFIFATTEPNKVLPTIQSRCQRFDFSSISPDVIGTQLKTILKSEKVKFDNDVIIALSRLANGSMRDALSLLDQLISTGVQPLTITLLEESLGQPNREKICQLVEKIGDNDAGAVLQSVDSLLKAGQTAVQIIDSLIDLTRDLIVIKSTDKKSDLVILTADERKIMSALTEKFDTPAMIYNITAMEKLRWTIKNSDNPRALLEASMLRFALAEHFMSIGQLLSRVNTGGPKPARTNVKKKSAPAVNSATPTTPPPATIPRIVTGEATAESIADNWQAILQALKAANGLVGGFLDTAAPADFNAGALTLTFPKSAQLQRQMCEKRTAQIEPMLAQAVGTDIKLKFDTTETQAPLPVAQPRGAKMDMTTRQEVLNDPAVQTLLTGLDAKVTDIEEVKED